MDGHAPPSPGLMDDDEPHDPLAARCEQAKAWTAGSLAVLLGAFVIGVQVIIALALIGVIFWAGRWIQLANRLRERDRDDEDEEEGDDRAAPPSNIIRFPRDP